MRQIILDTETTGLETAQGHRLIEIGCIEIVNRRFTGSQFHSYINPERDIDPGAQAVHGLSREFLSDKPRFTEVLAEFLAYIEGAELIIHNAAFDLGFLNYELALAGHNITNLAERCSVIDTLLLARAKHPGQKNSLDALCKRYSVDNSQRDLHGALLDSQLLGLVYLAMTGGQDTLFDETPAAKQQAQEMLKVNRTVGKLKIIYADSTELQVHQQYLTDLAKATEAGQSVWQQLETTDAN